jgi:hypothetical protein
MDFIVVEKNFIRVGTSGSANSGEMIPLGPGVKVQDIILAENFQSLVVDGKI